jgi:hypothetical protein
MTYFVTIHVHHWRFPTLSHYNIPVCRREANGGDAVTFAPPPIHSQRPLHSILHSGACPHVLPKHLTHNFRVCQAKSIIQRLNNV